MDRIFRIEAKDQNQLRVLTMNLCLKGLARTSSRVPGLQPLTVCPYPVHPAYPC